MILNKLRLRVANEEAKDLEEERIFWQNVRERLIMEQKKEKKRIHLFRMTIAAALKYKPEGPEMVDKATQVESALDRIEPRNSMEARLLRELKAMRAKKAQDKIDKWVAEERQQLTGKMIASTLAMEKLAVKLTKLEDPLAVKLTLTKLEDPKTQAADEDPSSSSHPRPFLQSSEERLEDIQSDNFLTSDEDSASTSSPSPTPSPPPPLPPISSLEPLVIKQDQTFWNPRVRSAAEIAEREQRLRDAKNQMLEVNRKLELMRISVLSENHRREQRTSNRCPDDEAQKKSSSHESSPHKDEVVVQEISSSGSPPELSKSPHCEVQENESSRESSPHKKSPPHKKVRKPIPRKSGGSRKVQGKSRSSSSSPTKQLSKLPLHQKVTEKGKSGLAKKEPSRSPSPRKGLGKSGRSPSPRKELGKSGRSPSPRKGLGKSGRSPSPRKGLGKSGRSPSPRKELGKSGRSPSPRKGLGKSGRSPSPRKELGKSGRSPSPRKELGKSGRSPSPRKGLGKSGRSPSPRKELGKSGRSPSPRKELGKSGRSPSPRKGLGKSSSGSPLTKEPPKSPPPEVQEESSSLTKEPSKLPPPEVQEESSSGGPLTKEASKSPPPEEVVQSESVSCKEVAIQTDPIPSSSLQSMRKF